MDEPRPLTRTQLRCIADWLPILESPGFNPGGWRGGEVDAAGATQMPWFDYSPQLRPWPGPCSESLVVVFDWMAWMQTPEARGYAGDAKAIDRATSTDLARLLTSIVRGDRFVEGNIVGAFESGVLAAISRRAAALLREAE